MDSTQGDLTLKIVVHEQAGSREISAVQGDSVLDALRAAGIAVTATCGGHGVCRKCRVLVHDDEGVSYKLACETPVADGMEVSVDTNYGMMVSLVGMQSKWGSDGAGWGYGFAIDVGTTTVVCRLYDLESGRLMGTVGRTNPQIVFGGDVISRITACKEGHLKDMSKLLGDLLVDMALELVNKAGIELSQVSYTVLAGNTVMEHIAAEFDPTSIGVAPFTPYTLFGMELDYLAFEQGSIAAGTTYFAPCISGYVGGDITCDLLAIDILNAEGPTLLVDLGTNGEIALGDASGVLTCATAAGPVFEGGNIKYGMPAYPGAISKVTFSGGNFGYTVISGADPTGICGTGLIDCVALALMHGIIDETGRILDDDEIDCVCSHGMERAVCEHDGQRCIQISDNVYVTQKDIRNLQLAKAAIVAGIRTLLKAKGIDVSEVKDFVIAGGFGQFLDLGAAARVGLIPDELLYCARSVGNSAIEGASALLLSDEATDELDSIVGACEYIELSESKEFNEFYLGSMTFA